MTSTITPATPAGPGAQVPSDLDEARAMGRELAREIAVPLAAAGQRGVEQMVRAGIPRLAYLGIRAEVVRSRPNCVVVRSAPGPVESECGCALITAWLESLPRVALRALGTVVESSCTTRGGTSCIHTLLWQVPGGGAATEGARAPVAATAPAPAVPGPVTRKGPATTPPTAPTAPAAPTAPTAPAPAPNGAMVPATLPSELQREAAPHLAPAQASEGSAATGGDRPGHTATGGDRPGHTADRRGGDRRATPVAEAPTPGERRGRDRRASRPELDVPHPDSWVGKATLAFRTRAGASTETGTAKGLPELTGEPGAPKADVTPRVDATPRVGATPKADVTPRSDDAPKADVTPRSDDAPPADETPKGSTAADTHPAVTTASAAHHDVITIPADRVFQQPPTGPLGTRSSGRGASGRRTSGRRSRWAWLRRRAWLVALGVVAGSGGGYLASAHHAPSYSATAVLVVRVGASPTGPGSANDALALAITDAALLSSDQSVVSQVATDLHLPVASVSHDIVAQAVAGTALLQVHFSAASPATAVAGANDVAAAVTGPRPNDLAIANGSVAEVARAKTASSSSSLYKHALPIGAVLGLLLGAGAALAAERADRRIDEAQALHDAAGCPVTVVPGGISPVELSRAIEHAAGSGTVTLVPLRRSQLEAARQLARELSGARVGAGAAGEPGEQIRVTTPFADAPDAAGRREGPVVLVVGAGERMRVVHEVAGRLRLLGRAPAWSILVRPS